MKLTKQLFLFLTVLCCTPVSTVFAQQCSNSPTWNSTTAYSGGAYVVYGNTLYQANWWTQGDIPSTNNGGAGTGQPWLIMSSCNTTPTITPSTATTPLNTFVTQAGSTSTVQSFTVNGANLVSNVIVSVNAPFKISTTGVASSFTTSSITLSEVNLLS